MPFPFDVARISDGGVTKEEREMNWLKRRYRNRLLIFAVGVGVSLWSGASFGADRDPPGDPHKGIREETLRVIALGTPDDLLRLGDALHKTEQEIARVKLGAVQPEKQAQLNAIRDRHAESEVLLRLLDSSANEIPHRDLDRSSAQERASLRAKLSGRIEALRESIGVIEQVMRFEQAEDLRILEDERRALGRLLAVRREELLQELARPPGCLPSERPCLARKFKTLCRLQPLLPVAERAPILILQQEVANQLDLGHGPVSSLCEYLRFDFGF
jgi:hypothetical protein